MSNSSVSDQLNEPADQADENAGDLALDALTNSAPADPTGAEADAANRATAANDRAVGAVAVSLVGAPPAIARLEAATRGLQMPSETDAPFRVVYWPLDQAQISPSEVALYLTENADASVETQSVEEFFRSAASVESWMNDDEKATAARFQQLIETLNAELENPQVYRLGQREITAAAIGKMIGGFGGVVTLIVET